jgi:hypothetical protein
MTICTTRQHDIALSFASMVAFLAILTACSPAPTPAQNDDALSLTPDWTATAAAQLLDRALVDAVATPNAIDVSTFTAVTVTPTSPPMTAVDVSATDTANAAALATAVAATLTALPTAPATPAPSPTTDATATAYALATAVAEQVATALMMRPTPTATSTATPLPTQVRTLRFHAVSLRSYANASTQEGYVSPPLGSVELGGVWFELPAGLNSITTQAEPLPDYPIRLVFSGLDIRSPRSVHLLLTGGNTRRAYADQVVGQLVLMFEDSSPVYVDLIPGWNLREWKMYGDHNVTWIEDAHTEQVWSGANRHDSGLGVIDMITVPLAENLSDGRLLAIEIVDLSVEIVGSLDPAINVLGISVLGE